MDDEGRHLLDVVRENAQKMARLIDDLLAFSRTGKRDLQLVPVNMTEMAQSVFEELVGEGAGERAAFSCQPLPEVIGDATMMRQVWMNLLANAIKFSGPVEHPAILVSGRTDGREVVYLVKDNGVGFDPEYTGKLFGVFQRLHAARDFDGTGVGLALVQRIIHRHGGRVWAEGKIGEGATFSFAIPVRGAAS